MTIPELIEILKAAEVGKVIQWRPESSTDWLTASGECRTLCRIVENRGELRVKPEPREGFVPKQLLFKSEDEAKAMGWGKYQLIHVLEIIDP